MTTLLITFAASFLIWVLFVGVAFLWMVDGRIKKELALHAIFTSFLAWGAAEMIKELLPIKRPYITEGVNALTLTNPATNAFPSTHAAVAFGLAVSLWLHDKKWGAAFLFGAVAIGLARVAGHVHYPLDIVGGAVLGAAVAFVVDKVHLYKLLTKKRS